MLHGDQSAPQQARPATDRLCYPAHVRLDEQGERDLVSHFEMPQSVGGHPPCRQHRALGRDRLTLGYGYARDLRLYARIGTHRPRELGQREMERILVRSRLLAEARREEHQVGIAGRPVHGLEREQEAGGALKPGIGSETPDMGRAVSEEVEH